MESITLYFKQGGSDKVYQVSIESKDSGYVVNYAYGRRGTTLATGTKTSTAVNYDVARAIYEKLIKEKQAKGYTSVKMEHRINTARRPPPVSIASCSIPSATIKLNHCSMISRFGCSPSMMDGGC